MKQVVLTVYAVGERMPDADTDVLIFDGPGPGQLGAFVGTSDDGAQHWVDAQGGVVDGVTHWADMPTAELRRPWRARSGRNGSP